MWVFFERVSMLSVFVKILSLFICGLYPLLCRRIGLACCLFVLFVISLAGGVWGYLFLEGLFAVLVLVLSAFLVLFVEVYNLLFILFPPSHLKKNVKRLPQDNEVLLSAFSVIFVGRISKLFTFV